MAAGVHVDVATAPEVFATSPDGTSPLDPNEVELRAFLETDALGERDHLTGRSNVSAAPRRFVFSIASMLWITVAAALVLAAVHYTGVLLLILPVGIVFYGLVLAVGVVTLLAPTVLLVAQCFVRSPGLRAVLTLFCLVFIALVVVIGLFSPEDVSWLVVFWLFQAGAIFVGGAGYRENRSQDPRRNTLLANLDSPCSACEPTGDSGVQTPSSPAA